MGGYGEGIARWRRRGARDGGGGAGRREGPCGRCEWGWRVAEVWGGAQRGVAERSGFHLRREGCWGKDARGVRDKGVAVMRCERISS